MRRVTSIVLATSLMLAASLVLVSLALTPVTAHAQQEVLPFLPDAIAVKESLLNSPGIASALARRDAQRERARGIQAGYAEFNVRSNIQVRRAGLPEGRSTEATIGLERPLRLWGKSAQDSALAVQTETVAGIEYSDALHEASRELLKQWFIYLRALADHRNAILNLEYIQQLQKQVERRLQRGELAQLDLTLASAELSRAEALRNTTDAQLASIRATFGRRYPTIVLPSVLPSFPTPPMPQGQQTLREFFLARNHELGLLRAETRRLQLLAQRLNLERTPDPTLGFYTSSDRGGAEKVSGISLSFPIAGPARTANARMALAEAQGLEAHAQHVEQTLTGGFDALWAQMMNKRSAAENLNEASKQQFAAAEKSRKAFTLGEYTLIQTLQVNRTASEYRHSAQTMKLEVLELLALLWLDLHEIWDLD
jgi:outer membrane protein TolC